MLTQERVEGYCDGAFRAVADVLEGTFAARQERGAAVAVCVDGRIVVDLWGGYADAAGERRWRRDTVVNVFSVTKGVVATCAHLLAARGLLDLEARVASYWPEFATAEKAGITVAQLLDHSAGLPAVRESLPLGSLYDWTAVAAALAAEAPWWEPGTRHGYHAVTFGFLVGEVLRRASGRTVRDLVREDLAGPLGIDLSIGLPEALADRAAYVPPTEPPLVPQPDHPMVRAMGEAGSVTMRAFTNPPDLVAPGSANDPRWRLAEIPASNGHANARALAQLYGNLASSGSEGARLLDGERVAAAAAERVSGVDVVLGVPTRFSLGFMLPSTLRPFSPGARAFGHPGAGGALGFGDLDARLGVGYTPSRTIASFEGGDPRWAPLVGAIYRCL
jgi:CubicO group peptidase (beta-lactamase class C family)